MEFGVFTSSKTNVESKDAEIHQVFPMFFACFVFQCLLSCFPMFSLFFHVFHVFFPVKLEENCLCSEGFFGFWGLEGCRKIIMSL